MIYLQVAAILSIAFMKTFAKHTGPLQKGSKT